MEISPLGDSAFLVRVTENFDDAPEDALNKVLAAKRSLESAKIPGVIEIAPAYTTVAAFYDPVRAVDAGAPADDIVGWFERRIREALSKEDFDRTDRSEKTPIEIPVCYESEFAFDLEDVARRARLDPKDVVDL